MVLDGKRHIYKKTSSWKKQETNIGKRAQLVRWNMQLEIRETGKGLVVQRFKGKKNIFCRKMRLDRKHEEHKGSEICGQTWENDRCSGQHYFEVSEVYKISCALISCLQIRFLGATSEKLIKIINMRQNKCCYIKLSQRIPRQLLGKQYWVSKLSSAL